MYCNLVSGPKFEVIVMYETTDNKQFVENGTEQKSSTINKIYLVTFGKFSQPFVVRIGPQI